MLLGHEIRLPILRCVFDEYTPIDPEQIGRRRVSRVYARSFGSQRCPLGERVPFG